ncbi:cytochrome c biogenesis CcdA family protein [Georgenia yuyongxinii]|uniref:Cytochrome c biogenesis protein CcdA n=1 Tax=Georgenia yuyongxinii TaxID=2589797 RepID=A0A552WSN0_9MICO|nr:cytochrome c biogenesis CcdA family protein [Georgenia yuyongxinii]TRW45747.1 cytochrome c biogenesis protein CcdA [Georgenia yuyongxinii]
MGSELLTTGSILAAFFAGGVALFAPCCIVFLAPSYLAGAVKNRRWRLLPLTFVFAAGLALVLVPITLGVSMIAGAINNYHAQLYWAGGLLMVAFAAFSLSGKMWSLPSFLRAPDTSRGDTASFFALGVFSGIASSCCAPVLAGVMTLSALSGSVAGGVALGLSYVFGMVFPLFVMALAWDKFRLGERRLFRAKLVKIRLVGRVLVTNTVNLAVAVAFAVMGVWVISLADSTDMTGGTAAQTAIAEWLAGAFGTVQDWLSPVPEPLLGLALLAVAAVFVVVTLRDRRRRPGQQTDEPGHQISAASAGDSHQTHDHEGLPR